MNENRRFWIGNHWTIKTKKFGGTVKQVVRPEIEGTMNGDLAVEHEKTDGLDLNEHYTNIEITNHNHDFKGRTISKIKD